MNQISVKGDWRKTGEAREDIVHENSDVRLEILNYGIKSKSAQSLPRNRSVNLHAILV